ncbi:hypothetical protein [Pseudomonas quasicaspiana]|uniref:hypothetical protein n=1 Tax=Pseudomonas quasicaspiana TaxID=2829821 RepID=UPI001E534A34|nr:hypothetical protein [Pseudomonas quasicaspiana]MCD5976759.1 hypothetical protein [Pseudomonas quasicaspiana]
MTNGNSSPTNSEDSSPRKSDFRAWINVEATFWIALITALTVLNGYAYLDELYSTLDVPVGRLELSLQTLSAFGGAGLFSTVGGLVITAVAVLIFVMALAFLESPDDSNTLKNGERSEAGRYRRRFSQLYTPLTLTAKVLAITIIGIIIWWVSIKIPSEAGRRVALKKVTECTPRTLTYANTDKVTGCLIAESADMFYLVEYLGSEGDSVSFRTFQLSKTGFVKLISERQNLKLDGR